MSDHIVDIYGYCGAAGFYEFGEGDMANLIRLETKNDIFSIREKINGKKYLKRLKYAVDVANAIADLHTIESYKDGMFSAIVHGESNHYTNDSLFQRSILIYFLIFSWQLMCT